MHISVKQYVWDVNADCDFKYNFTCNDGMFGRDSLFPCIPNLQAFFFFNILQNKKWEILMDHLQHVSVSFTKSSAS